VKRGLRWLAFGAGVALFAWYLRGTDLAAVGTRLRDLGWATLLLPLPYLLVYAVDTWAWRWAFARNPAVPFRTLFRIRWCGESVNNLIPTAYVGGEALKVLLLQRRGVPTPDATAAAMVSKTAQTVAQVLFLALGSAAFLLHAGSHPGLRTALATVMLGGLAVVAVLLAWQRRGVFRSLLAVFDRIGFVPRALESRRTRLLELDTSITAVYATHRRRIAASTALFLAGWLLDTVEIWMVSHLLDLPIAWTQALAIEAFIGVVKVIGLWIPGALGVQESGIVTLVRLAGGPDLLGATYALLRRTRELLFTAAGWLLLLVAGDATRDTPPPDSRV
jgi:putative membrane protein